MREVLPGSRDSQGAHPREVCMGGLKAGATRMSSSYTRYGLSADAQGTRVHANGPGMIESERVVGQMDT